VWKINKTKEKQKVILRKMIWLEYFCWRIWWVGNPEIEMDAGKRIEKRRRFYRAARFNLANYIILTIISVVLGLFLVATDFFAFLMFACVLGLSGGLITANYLCLLYLMNEVDYQNHDEIL